MAMAQESFPEAVRATAPFGGNWWHRSSSQFEPRLLRLPVFLWKYFVGMLFCQSLLGSVAVVGWTYRLMQRTLLMSWWKRSLKSDYSETFADFLLVSRRTEPHLRWPNWIMEPRRCKPETGEGDGGPRRTLRTCFYSLWLNFKIGFQGIVNTWILTLPPCLLWSFSWYDGWNNSFNKGYEQAPVGPLIGISGVVLFIAVMFYLPMAQARQAATGEWRSFYSFKLIWSLIRRRSVSCLLLASFYSIFSLPVMVLLIFPSFLPQVKPAWGDLAPAEALKLLQQFFFWSAALVFPCYVFLRVCAARIYASALVEAVQRGAIMEDQLTEAEWEPLHRLGLLTVQSTRPWPRFLRMIHWVGTRAGKVTISILTFFIWFTFVAQIFIGQFFNYHPGIGWLNQPLVQLPAFHYIPAALKNAK